MNKFLSAYLCFFIASSATPVLARSQNFVEFKDEKITVKNMLLKAWGKPSTEIDFNLAGKKYLYLRYTDSHSYPLADFTVDPQNNTVLERLYYPQQKVDGNTFEIFMEKHFKDVSFDKVLDSCSHHDQFIHYNKSKDILVLSHQVLNKKRLVDVVGYSNPEIIEKRLLENKTKKCGIKK